MVIPEPMVVIVLASATSDAINKLSFVTKDAGIPTSVSPPALNIVPLGKPVKSCPANIISVTITVPKPVIITPLATSAVIYKSPFVTKDEGIAVSAVPPRENTVPFGKSPKACVDKIASDTVTTPEPVTVTVLPLAIAAVIDKSAFVTKDEGIAVAEATPPRENIVSLDKPSKACVDNIAVDTVTTPEPVIVLPLAIAAVIDKSAFVTKEEGMVVSATPPRVNTVPLGKSPKDCADSIASNTVTLPEPVTVIVLPLAIAALIDKLPFVTKEEGIEV